MMPGFVLVDDLPKGRAAWGCTADNNNCCKQAVDGCPECFVAHCFKHSSQDHDRDCARAALRAAGRRGGEK